MCFTFFVCDEVVPARRRPLEPSPSARSSEDVDVSEVSKSKSEDESESESESSAMAAFKMSPSLLPVCLFLCGCASPS